MDDNAEGRPSAKRFPDIIGRVRMIKDHYRLRNADIDRAMGVTAGYTNRMMCLEKPLSTQHVINFYSEYKFNFNSQVSATHICLLQHLV